MPRHTTLATDAAVEQEADLYEGWSWTVIPAGRTLTIPPGRVMVTLGPVDIEAGAFLDGEVVEV